MTAAELQSLIHSRIPLAAFMQAQLLAVSADGVELQAPLEPNLNVHGTLFGGSASALCLLAAWALLHWRSQQCGLEVALVVRGHAMSYRRPVTGPVKVVAAFGHAQAWADFEQQARASGRGRIGVDVQVLGADEGLCARMQAEFAVGAK